MSTKLLKVAYSPDTFREQGHQLIDLLASHLETTLKGKSDQVIRWHPPEEEHKFWKAFLREGDEAELHKEIISRCIHIHHPNYMGHQISPAVPPTALTALLSALLNNGMGIYEMGSAPTAMERIVTDRLCATVEYPEGSNGFLTSGGTLANLTALLSARKRIVKHNIWEEGNKSKLAIMVSEEAHYCIGRAAKIMGLGEDGIVKIPVTAGYALNTDLLREHFEKATSQGREIFAIVGSAPSTATGVYDDLNAIAHFAGEQGIWFHVDAAHGGAAIFSEKYRGLLDGVKLSDSIVIDGHKMMTMPSITTALLFKDGENSHHTFRQKADYLLEESEEEDWYNLAKRTFECTKYMMSLYWYSLFKTYGNQLFDDFVTALYDLGAQFGQLIGQEPNFELAVQPMSNIICFRYVAPDLDPENLDRINSDIRKRLLEDGKFYIVQTRLKERHFLRVTLMNPFTTRDHMLKLLEEIKLIAAKVI